jgi:hypothetical protein
VPAPIVEKSYNPPNESFLCRVILSTDVNEFEGEQEYETESAPDLGPLKNSRPPINIVIFIVLALIGAGAAFFWYEYGSVTEALTSFESETAPPVVSLKAFEEYQQAVDESLQRDHELLKVQGAQLKS